MLYQTWRMLLETIDVLTSPKTVLKSIKPPNKNKKRHAPKIPVPNKKIPMLKKTPKIPLPNLNPAILPATNRSKHSDKHLQNPTRNRVQLLQDRGLCQCDNELGGGFFGEESEGIYLGFDFVNCYLYQTEGFLLGLSLFA